MAALTDHFLKAIAFFWLIATLITSTGRLRLFLWLLVLASLPLSLTALQNFASGSFLRTPDGAAPRIAGYAAAGSGLAANPNDLALMINLLIPFAAALMLASRRLLPRLVAAAALLLGIAGVIVTFSRAGFLTLAAMGLVGLLALGRRRPLALMAVVAVLIGATTLLPQGYFERLSTITDIASDTTGSAQGRWNDALVAMEVAARNPITGVGLDQNVLALNQERGATWREVHNVYLQYAVDLGVPGLTLFLALFVSLFRTAGRVRRTGRRRPASREVGRGRGQRAGGARRLCRGGLLPPRGVSVLLLPRSRSGARGPERPAGRDAGSGAAGGMSREARVDDRIRLLKIVPTLRYGGTERQFMTLSASLDPSRFQVDLACLRPGGGLAAEAVRHGLPVDTYDIGPFHSARTLTLQSEAGARHRAAPDRRRARLQLLRQRLRGAAGAVRRRAGRHCVHSGLRPVPVADAAARPAARVPRRHLRHGQRGRGPGLAGGRRLRPHRIVVIPNGVDLERFNVPVDGAAVRRGLGFDPEVPLVTVVSRVTRLKGLEQFITRPRRSWRTGIRARGSSWQGSRRRATSSIWHR